jgi:uncharacterized membrane protein YeiH
MFGVIIAIALIIVIQRIGHAIMPPPTGVDFSDPDAVRAMMREMPLPAYLAVILSYVIGTFGGGLLAGLLARETPILYATVIGAFVLAGTILNVYAIPHPTWFVVAAIVSIVATAYFTSRVSALLITDRN